jgi:hypothetical protein
MNGASDLSLAACDEQCRALEAAGEDDHWESAPRVCGRARCLAACSRTLQHLDRVRQCYAGDPHVREPGKITLSANEQLGRLERDMSFPQGFRVPLSHTDKAMNTTGQLNDICRVPHS